MGGRYLRADTIGKRDWLASGMLMNRQCGMHHFSRRLFLILFDVVTSADDQGGKYERGHAGGDKPVRFFAGALPFMKHHAP